MNTFEVALRSGTLPAEPLELAKMIYLGESGLKFILDNLKKADVLDIPEEQRSTMLAEGQRIGEILLRAEAKIGELSKSIEGQKISVLRRAKGNHVEEFKKTGTQKHEKLGLQSKIHLANAQAINNHPDVVDKVIKQAKENDDIPTKTAVINQIRYEKAEKRIAENSHYRESKQINKEVDKSTENAQNYFNAIKEYKRVLKSSTEDYTRALKLAINAKSKGFFAPESRNFMKKKHDEIAELFAELQDSYTTYQEKLEEWT